MREADRFKLLGTYRTPRVRIGAVLSCEARDCDVVVVGFTDGKIRWPLARRRVGPYKVSPVLFGDLARAVRRESNQAVAHWFGIHPRAVSRLRKALDVGHMNAGTARLRVEYSKEDWFREARRHLWRRGWTAGRERALAALRVGKAKKAGRPEGLEWSKKEDRLVRTLPPAEAAQRIGRTLTAVYDRRSLLKVPDGRAHNGRTPQKR